MLLSIKRTTTLTNTATLFECENLDRKYIGFDINPEMIDYVETAMSDNKGSNYYIANCNSLNTNEVDKTFSKAFEYIQSESCQFALLHPPYMDIVKFTENENDLSTISDLDIFLDKFKLICENTLKYLDKNRYFAIVIGDVYKNSEVIPLSFYCMDMIKKHFKVKLKGTIIKNIEGSRGKLGVGGIWRYRALNSDYYIFKHEYIFVFKKEF